MERTLGSRECFLLGRRAEQSSKQSKKQSLPTVEPRGSPEYNKPKLSLWVSAAASLQPAPHGLRPGASLPVHQLECHMLKWKQGCLWMPNVITSINHSSKDQHRDLSLFISNETPHKEQYNTAETQGRHPISGAMLAPVTKPQSHECSHSPPWHETGIYWACAVCMGCGWRALLSRSP